MKRVEFIIIGQGLAGTMLAFEFLKHKIKFRILASPVKSRASVVAAGMVNPLVFKRLTKSWLADLLLPEMKKQFSEIENLLGKPFYFEKEILKPLSAQELDLWTHKMENPEFSAYIMSVGKGNYPGVCSESGYYGTVAGSGYANLSELLNSSKKYFLENNLLLEQDFDFASFNPGGKSFSFGGISAEKIIFCEGYHLQHNPFFSFIKLNPVKGEVLQLVSNELSENYILNKNVFVLPVGNQRFKVGSTYEWDDLTEMPTQSGRTSILNRLEKLVEVKFEIESHVAGVRPAVSDRRPVLGIHPEYKNLAVFNGLGTKGVMLAPYFASEMVKILTLNNYETFTEARLERFL